MVPTSNIKGKQTEKRSNKTTGNRNHRKPDNGSGWLWKSNMQLERAHNCQMEVSTVEYAGHSESVEWKPNVAANQSGKVPVTRPLSLATRLQEKSPGNRIIRVNGNNKSNKHFNQKGDATGKGTRYLQIKWIYEDDSHNELVECASVLCRSNFLSIMSIASS
ncbi:unnamed protein product [Mytilus edulis]|uniref:Uncharacterized protein n=1 Tax=Mytilus edulis TaxID=6550 RepID=A0A8S3QKG1_MYTED|nr:unnamed protein product [Mytilus edulis]